MVLKELILTVAHLGRCGGLEITDIFLTASIFRGCCSLARTDLF